MGLGPISNVPNLAIEHPSMCEIIHAVLLADHPLTNIVDLALCKTLLGKRRECIAEFYKRNTTCLSILFFFSIKYHSFQNYYLAIDAFRTYWSIAK